MEKSAKKSKKNRIRKWEEDCWARIFSFFLRIQFAASAKQEESTVEEEMKQQQRMAIMKDLIKKNRSKGSTDATKSLVGRGVACDRLRESMDPHMMGGHHAEMVGMAGIHEEERLEGKMEEMHQRKVEKMIKSADGSAELLHKITKPTMWIGRVQILKQEEEDVRLLDRCEAKRKEWAKCWQCDEEIQNMQNKPWRN